MDDFNKISDKKFIMRSRIYLNNSHVNLIVIMYTTKNLSLIPYTFVDLITKLNT